MNYRDGVIEMSNRCTAAKENGQIMSFEVCPRVRITYPGKKDAVGDYKVSIAGKMFSHSDMCIMVATYILNGNMTYEDAVRFLEDVYEHGTDNPEANIERQYLKTILFWTTLQEEINYPQGTWNSSHTRLLQGRRKAFNLYAEAVAAAAGRDTVAYDVALFHETE